MIRWLATAFAALLLAASPAAAQIQQSGTVSPGHASCWVTSGLLKDGGSPANFQCNALGLYNGTNSPLGISSQTAAGALSGTWGTLTLGSTSSAASLTTLNSAGTAQPLNLAIGGDATYAIGGANWLSTIFGQQFCTTTGAVLYRDSGGTWKCLAPGTSGQVLQTQGPNLNPQWAGSGGIGTVTSITAGTGLSGGTITTSGTIALLNPVAVNLGGTGAATLAAHGVLIGNGTTAVNVATPGVAGTVLQSNGVGADPTWNAVAGTGTVTSITAANSGVVVSPSPLITSGTIALGPATSSILGGVKPDGTTITNTAGAISVTNPVTATAPTFSACTSSGTGCINGGFGGAGTYTTPANVKWIQVVIRGGGGGGGGAGTGAQGGTGGTTSFGTFTAIGGTGGTGGGGAGVGIGGAGGSGGAGTAIQRIAGTIGADGYSGSGSASGGGRGGDGGGGTPGPNFNQNSNAGVANTGQGGSGGSGDNSTYFAGGGGGQSEYAMFIITAPAATYTYSNGAGGSGGTGTHVGGVGGTGGIWVVEHYNY